MERQVEEIGALEDNNSSQGPYNSLSLHVREGSQQAAGLVQAIAIVSQIESIIPRLIEVHKNLHNSEDRVRFLCNRAYRGAIEKQAPLERNNTLRRKLNRLKHDLISMIKGVRQEMALLLGISSGRTTNTIALDLMEPLERFAELEREAHERSQPNRFSAELSDLRALLSDLHRDASHLRRFIQGIRRHLIIWLRATRTYC
ncbi:hypothetical protein TGRH88_029610 [Toxoplasma gondii]|uniref:Uncharacterized protein n=1 Tax=Toxoplasma gondii TaxID=5811 RepID=A0A7J6K8J0_TOXGO|nr:hypothetical protein TGRH88_029610 [Toxoplasma gondii]